MKKSKDKQKEKSIEEITQTEIDIKEKSKKHIYWNKMYGPEFEYIKEYKPIESKDNVIENILDNNIEELIDIKYNKPIIKSEEKVVEEKPKIKKKKKGTLDKKGSVKEEPDIIKKELSKEETSKEIKEEPIKEIKEESPKEIRIT